MSKQMFSLENRLFSPLETNSKNPTLFQKVFSLTHIYFIL